MIDPKNITSFNLSQDGLEEVLLFWICAAGKNGTTAANSLEKLLSKQNKKNKHPFDFIRLIDKQSNLAEEMRKAGIGCYNNKAKTFRALAYSGLNLKICSVEELEAIPGIGPKTARCFLMHSRPNQKYAGLDRHILNFMSDCGISTPKNSPSGKKYKNLEQIFLKIAEMSKKSVADLDLLIWKVYSNRHTDESGIEFLNRLKSKWIAYYGWKSYDKTKSSLGSSK